jgi:hypothetical protein
MQTLTPQILSVTLTKDIAYLSQKKLQMICKYHRTNKFGPGRHWYENVTKTFLVVQLVSPLYIFIKSHFCLLRYKLMLQCWEANPEIRPTFHEIADILKKYSQNDKVP